MEIQSTTANSSTTPNKIGVGALLISIKSKRVLLNLRAPHKTHAMCWSLWGGMMEDGEQPKEALLREFTEEMGFLPDIERIYPFDIYQSKDRHFKYISFVVIIPRHK